MTELKAQVAWMENVSGLHMLFIFWINFMGWFLGNRETVNVFKKEIVS